MSVTSDGWLKANNPTSTCRSPNGLTIDAHAYRFIKMRIKGWQPNLERQNVLDRR